MKAKFKPRRLTARYRYQEGTRIATSEQTFLIDGVPTPCLVTTTSYPIITWGTWEDWRRAASRRHARTLRTWVRPHHPPRRSNAR